MEKPRHRKSRSLTAIEEGNLLAQNYRVTRRPSDLHSYNDEHAKRDMHMFITARGSSKYSTGESMKKLLANDLSKEMEAKRRSPSVVARLMGLDGLPSPQRGHRQEKMWSSNQQRETLSKVVLKDEHLFDGQSSKRSSLDHKQFKDVYEDLEAYHVATQRNPSKWNSKLKKPEMSILEQKLPLSKPRHRDLNASSGFTENIGAVNSNDELLLKFLMQPDSLCVKHVNDLPCNPSSSLHRHISILKPLNSEKYESNAKAWNSGKECSCKNCGRAQRNRKDGLLLDPPIRQSSAKSPEVLSDETRVKHKLPTQIVVLKPRKSSDTTQSVLSPDFSHPYVAHRRRPSDENVGAAPRASSPLSDFQGISRPKCREAREVAKKITGQIKETFASFDSRPMSFKYSKERGYAGDESSNDVYDSDSDSMSDIITVKPGKLSFRNNQCRGSADSSVNTEAKKRLSERWKIANKYQSEEIMARSSTLGEMLELPGKKRSPGPLDVHNSRGDRTIGLASNSIMCVQNGPSGISSNDGWKDGCTEKMSRSIITPLGSKSRKKSERLKAQPSDWHVLTRDTIDQCKSRAVDGNITCIEGFSPKVLRSDGKGHLSCEDKYVVNIVSTSETTSSVSKTMEKLESSVEQSMGFCEPEHVVSCIPDLSASEINIGDMFACDQEDSILQEPSIIISEEGPALPQCPAPEPETSESFSDAEHPSPISVLEATSSSSGSEGFRGVFDGLQELRKQLQLLKMDSTEVSTIVTNNDDFLPQIEEDNLLNIESWEDMYIVDLLINSGLEKLHLPTLNSGCQSLHIPVGVSIFDTLEKKYSDGIAERRSERKLLFDRINSMLVDIFLQDIDSCPWLKAAPRRIDSNWQNHSLKEELNRLLALEDKGTEDPTPIKMLDIEMEWSSYRTDIFLMGKDIEKILTDELIMEVVSV
ncbi:hypothetical protein Leryth_008726 [Lithospermum erythrorhizon]|nr:hypothetical protein Leryth_008726 [Lithospermum erythrorhizon]